jgi:shikimate dehydrogenase
MSAAALPMVIASLPARTPDAARREVELARAAGADVAEIRFDRWGREEWDHADRLFPSALPLIATLRSRAEGGGGPDDPAERAAWLRSLDHLPFSWVDLEAGRDDVPASPGPFPRFIVSSHLPAGADPSVVHARLGASVPASAIVKVVLAAPVATALREVVPAVQRGPRPAIVHTTGPSGALLRAWSRRLGLAGVYGALPPGGGSDSAVEPSQIPVDRLRRYLDGPADAPLFAVVGRPVLHSRSPDLHHAWLRAHHRTSLYVPLEFASDAELLDALPRLAEGRFRGLNVTHPFKETALVAATEVRPSAQRCGVANTLTLADGRVVAENTDVLAIRRRLEELRASGAWSGQDALVIGTGGAARASLAALSDLQASARVLGRRPERVRAVCEAFGAEAAAATAPAPVGLLLQATTVGRTGDAVFDPPLTGWIDRSTYCLDWVYAPHGPSLRETVQSVGARYEDGHRLLAYSAAASYAAWWDAPPSDAQIEAALGAIA